MEAMRACACRHPVGSQSATKGEKQYFLIRRWELRIYSHQAAELMIVGEVEGRHYWTKCVLWGFNEAVELVSVWWKRGTWI